MASTATRQCAPADVDGGVLAMNSVAGVVVSSVVIDWAVSCTGTSVFVGSGDAVVCVSEIVVVVAANPLV